MNGLNAYAEPRDVIVVVASFPRSGTHFLIDFLRKNFAPLDASLPIWRSSEALYLDLDRIAIDQDWALDSTRRKSFIVKTHQLPFSLSVAACLQEISIGRRTVYLTPVRNAEASLRSYARFVEHSMHKSISVQGVDPFYRNGKSTGEMFEGMYHWASDNSNFVDVERGKLYPSDLAKDLGQLLNITPKHLADRLPHSRFGGGIFFEAIGRLSGRESSDVVIPKRPLSSQIEVPASFDALTEDAKARALPRTSISSAISMIKVGN
jgi:hypothetical protein